jgi:uncharacterized protein YkwD
MAGLTRRGVLVMGAGLLLSGCTNVYAPSTATAPTAVTPEQMLAEINSIRRGNGQGPLVFNTTLERAARNQARMMAEHDALSHNFGPGLTLRERVTAVGYSGPVGENVAGGQRTLEGALTGWMQSSGHRATLLSDRWGSVGMAVVQGRPGSRYGVFWAAIFGS